MPRPRERKTWDGGGRDFSTTPVKQGLSPLATQPGGSVAPHAARPEAREAYLPPRAASVRTTACVAFLLAGWLSQPSPVAAALLVVAYLAGGAGPAVTMLAALRHGQLNVDLLMILAALGAAATGEAVEGAVLLFLFSLSNTLEAYAMFRTRHSIRSLVRLRPREATRVRDGDGARVAIDELAVGDIIRVHPGERFPVDGAVVEGASWADEATLTGESAPVRKGPGAAVFAGTINGRGSLLVRMTRAVGDTVLERIVRSVEEAQAGKTTTQTFLESWQRPYVTGVLLAAGLMFVGSWLLHDQDWHDAFYHAMVLLVVASPCAVVVGGPAAVLSAIARAARQGVLFKGGAHLEALGRAQVIAFDKTGTITVGRPDVTAVWAAGADPDRLLARAAAVELRSEHHLAAAVVAEARRRGLTLPEVRDFESHTGQGVHARVDGRWVGVGREELFAEHQIAIPPAVLAVAQDLRAQGQTTLLVVADDGSHGVLALADQPRPGAAESLAALRQFGVGRIVLLTGDHERVARAVAARVGADDVRAGLMPDQKVVELRRLMDGGSVVAMVGDGVNDAPALAAAQVGVAMGGAGTDVALEVADVVLMSDDLSALPFAVWLSRRARQRVRHNLTFAFGVIGLLAVSSFLGLPLWLGVIGHEGSTVLVILNGLRLLWEPTEKSWNKRAASDQ